ncbi:hypothetical protein ACFQI7_12905 [Paenibacillus allorhizosphaerae]|uniref:hypothetical protein n=1 Tax=Paenibacillus allorhizosphaerae TaxID=2849866 RepID=UPI001C403E4C|nr:hypothetical protein [Paenibacillus allorhizosphaerae]
MIATNLAVSGMESFIGYLDTYVSGNRDQFLTGYPGFGVKDYKLPEGTPVLYQLTKTGPANNAYAVTISVSVGAGSAARTKTITYTINATAPVGTIITTDPNQRRPVPVSPEGIYVQGSASGVPSNVNITKNNGLQTAIGDTISLYESHVNASIESLEKNAVLCTCRNENDIAKAVSSSTKNPVIIKMAQDVTLDNNVTFNFGTSSRPVVLIFENVTFNNTASVNITGDLIVKNNMMINGNNSDITLNRSENSYGNLLVKGTLTGNNSVEITAPNMMYAGSITFNNNTPVSAGKLVIKNNFVVNNNTTLNVASDMLTGAITVNNNSSITASAGDIFIQNNFLSNNNVDLRAGGSIAAGGSFTINGNNSTINTGGATSSLIINEGSGGGTGNGNGGAVWNPSRQ